MKKVLNKCAECGKDFDHIPWIFASEFEIKDNEFNAKKLNHPEQFCSKECGKKYIQQNKDL